MSKEYDLYLQEHKANVAKAFRWIEEHVPILLKERDMPEDLDLEQQICFGHDHSKIEQDEYEAYDKYFYGNNRSYGVVQDFNRAFLFHLHRNPHHWQYWILTSDSSEEGEKLIPMPYNYILEMFCDWWSFSHMMGKLDEVFTWYEERKDHIKLHQNSRGFLETILYEIKQKLDELDIANREMI